MTDSTNGNYVTRAELKANLDPMRNDITEIKGDVKTLLAREAGATAVRHFKERSNGVHIARGTLYLSVLSLLGWVTKGFSHIPFH
jgi:hypothetical protein